MRGLFCVLIFSALSMFFTQAEMITGKCIGVSDGDTCRVLTPDKELIRVRFWGIDAPESKQDFGQVSKKALSDLIFNKHIRLDVVGKDRYGRTLSKVYVGEKYVDLEMVKKGMAWHYAYFAKDAKDLAKAEKSARAKKLGLWKQANPTPPWEWRRKDKKSAPRTYSKKKK